MLAGYFEIRQYRCKVTNQESFQFNSLQNDVASKRIKSQI